MSRFGFRLEPRTDLPKWLPWAVPVGSFLAALVVGAAVLAITGQNRDRCRAVLVKCVKGIEEQLGCQAVYGIASLRPLQRNDRDRPFFANLNRSV